jgi:hypothetical protein
MNFRTLLVFLFTFFASHIFSQKNEYNIPNFDFFKKIQSEHINYARLYYKVGECNLLPIDTYPFSSFSQSLFFYNKQIYVHLNSSGIVYKSKSYNILDDSIVFERVDSTSLNRYNINSYSFFYKDTLFNIGGYGFWRWNGQLRYLKEANKDWDIMPINKEYAISLDDNNIWYDINKGILISMGYKIGNKSTFDTYNQKISFIDSVITLDLRTKIWENTGSINAETRLKLLKMSKICDLDSGILYNNLGVLEYWNLINNSISYLDNVQKSNFINNNLKIGSIIWAIDHTIYITSKVTPNKIDSLDLYNYDFKDSGIIIYEKNSIINYIGLIITSIAAALLFIFLFYNKRYQNNQSLKLQNNSLVKVNEIMELMFSGLESSFIYLIIKNKTESNINVNIDELNTLLGTSKKSNDIQKKQRSDIVNSINKKWYLINQSNENELIHRIRLETDKRIVEYFINPDNYELVKKYLI